MQENNFSHVLTFVFAREGKLPQNIWWKLSLSWFIHLNLCGEIYLFEDFVFGKTVVINISVADCHANQNTNANKNLQWAPEL